MIRAWMPSNGVRSRRAIVSMSTSYSRQFSSPPVSCMYSRCLPSHAQAKNRIPRSASSVTAFAPSHSTPSALTGATHTLSTPSRGAIQASWRPSGEMCGLMRSGLPKSTSRGMRSAMPNAYHTAGHVSPRGAGAQPMANLAGEPVRRGGRGVVVDVLFLLVLLQPGGPELAADARLAEAAPLGLRQVRMVVVDPHRAVAECAGHPFGLARIGGPHRARQAVAGVVAEPDGLLLGAEPLDRHYRAEHLLLHHRHLPTAPGEHRGPQEEAALELGRGRPLAAGQQLRPLG